MAAVDYETEYNNRARVPEHPEIFARWTREAEMYRAETLEGRTRGTRPVLRRYAAAKHRPVPAGSGGNAPLALFIHGGWWRSLDPSHVQPDGARAQCARRHGRGCRLRSVPGCRDRRHHRADAPRLRASCGSASAGASLFTAIRPAAISPPPWWRPIGRRSIPRRRPIWCRPVIRSPAFSISRPHRHQRQSGFEA